MPSFSVRSTASTPKRRLLLQDSITSRSSVETVVPRQNGNAQSSECAKLVTTNASGRKEAIILCLDRPVIIGRNPHTCTYVIEDRVVSSIHCKLYAVLSSNGGVIVSVQDLSTNGVKLNGHRLRKTAAIVVDGDEIEISNAQTFKCVHTQNEPRQKMNIFEPTPPQGAYKNLKVGSYIIMSHCLGSGSFATVHLAIDTRRARQVACKTIIAKGKDRNDMQKIMKEVNILRGLRHPNVNRVLDVEVNERNGWLHIFLELCTGGDLFTYIGSRQRLGEGEAKYIMYQLFKGIKYLHERSISHRDLKPENIMLYHPGPYPRIQIADFGLARERAYQETRNVCGTVAYLPPEGVVAMDHKELSYLGMPSDCWSAGVILYIMLSGSHPFDYRGGSQTDTHSGDSQSRLPQFSQGAIVSEHVVKQRIVNGGIEFCDIWDSMPDAKRLVERLLIYDHKCRESIYGALQSTWITSDLEDLQKSYLERIGPD